MTRAQNLAVVATCVVAATTYAGAVTMDGMAAYVLPSVLGAALVGSFLAARRMSGAALIFGGVLVLGWSELVNVWSGTGAGPAARSTAVAGVCTLIAVVTARSSSPALFLLPVAGSVCGALLLGAGAEVRIVAVAAVVSAALTLGWIEQSRRNWSGQPRRGPALVLLSLLVGAVAAGAVLLQAQRDSTPPEALAAGREYPGIKPPWTDPLGTAAARLGSPPPSLREATQQPPPHSRGTRQKPPPAKSVKHPQTNNKPPAHTSRPQPASQRKLTSSSRIWLYVLAAVVLLALVLAARLVAVRLAWRRLQRRLASGAIAEQITGAWTWTRMRLDACKLPLGAAVSPDALAGDATAIDLPANVFAPLQRLARWTTAAAFASGEPLAPADVTAAWKFAGLADASARELLTRSGRTRLAFRGPASKEAARR